MKAARARPGPPGVLPTALAALLITCAASWALQGPEDPVTFRPMPGRKGQPVDLPRGDILLIQFLQRLADSTGETVCYKGPNLLEAKVHLPHAVATLDLAAARDVLAAESLELSEADYKGKPVRWVQRLIVPPRQKAKIVRREEGKDDGPERASPAPEAVRGAPALKLYTLEGGSGARYMVILETDSRQDAEEAMSLLKAHVRSRH